MQPVRSSPRPIEKDQEHRIVLPNPQVIIAHIHVKRVRGAGHLQSLRCLELKECQARFDVAVLIVGEQQQIIPIILFEAMCCVTLIDDEPLDEVDALVGDHMLPRALLFGAGIGRATSRFLPESGQSHSTAPKPCNPLGSDYNPRQRSRHQGRERPVPESRRLAD